MDVNLLMWVIDLMITIFGAVWRIICFFKLEIIYIPLFIVSALEMPENVIYAVLLISTIAWIIVVVKNIISLFKIN